MLKNLLQNQQNLKARGIYSCTGIYFFKSAFISLICIFLSVGCGGKKIKQKTEVKNDMTLSQEKRDNVGKYLFNANEMESIEISGKDLRKRKKIPN